MKLETSVYPGKWIIWNPKSTQPITTTYNSETQALKVCKFLAEKHPGETFMVAEIISSIKAEL
jgi:hypothetical protein